MPPKRSDMISPTNIPGVEACIIQRYLSKIEANCRRSASTVGRNWLWNFIIEKLQHRLVIINTQYRRDSILAYLFFQRRRALAIANGGTSSVWVSEAGVSKPC